MRLKLIRWISLLLAGCASHPTSWMTDFIAAGDPAFDSSRLRYCSSQAHPPLNFEIVRVGDQIEAFLSLNRFRFSKNPVAKISLMMGGEIFETEAPIHEGRMKLRLPDATTQRIIEALQRREKVVIILDDFEETLDPEQFAGSFAKFSSSKLF